MKKRYVFPIRCEGADELKYIFPSKQLAAQKAIEIAKADSRIKRLIVFGSAVTMNCGVYSDIDVAVELNVDSEKSDVFYDVIRPFYQQVPSEIDIINYDAISNQSLKNEIDTKGVVLWSR